MKELLETKQKKKFFLINKTDIIYSLLLVIFTTALFYYFHDISNADLTVPLINNGGDGFFTQSVLKKLEEGWNYNINTRLGAPLQKELYDFSLYADHGNFMYYKFLTFLTGNYRTALNLGFYLYYVLTALSSYFVLRQLNVKEIISWSASLTYAFSSFRGTRSMGHLFLNNYILLPVITLFLIWILQDNQFLAPVKGFWRYKKNVFAVIVLVIFSGFGIYYSFFACFFLVITVFYKCLKKDNQHKALSCLQGLLMLLLIIIPILLRSIPSRIFIKVNGQNPLSPYRDVLSTQNHSLKLSNFFIPNTWNKTMPFLNKVVEVNNGLQTGESSDFFGFLGIIGFMLIIVVVLLKTDLLSSFLKNEKATEIVRFISILTVIAVFFSVPGGFNTLFAMFVTPMIRCWNRISIYLLFFSLLTLSVFINALVQNYKLERNHLTNVCIILFTFITIYTQFPVFNSASAQNLDNFYSQKELLVNMEETLGEGAMVFQMPYAATPEAPQTGGIFGYAQSDIFLSSNTLRGSSNGYKGRNADNLVKNIHAQYSYGNINLVNKIVDMGFTGIYLYREGYEEDEFEELVYRLNSMLETRPIVSTNELYYFYDLRFFIKSYEKKVGTDYLLLQNEVLKDIIVRYENGFKYSYSYSLLYRQPADSTCQLLLTNLNDNSVKINISFLVEPIINENIEFRILNKSNTVLAHGVIGEDVVDIDFSTVLQPGDNLFTLQLKIDGKFDTSKEIETIFSQEKQNLVEHINLFPVDIFILK